MRAWLAALSLMLSRMTGGDRDAAFMRALGSASRALNRALGGRPGESLCGRMTRTRSHDCLFCRVVGWVLRDAEHCWRQRIYELTTTKN